MPTIIQVCIKSVYGNDTIYSVCETAKGIAALAGTKTLTENSLRIIRSMGFKGCSTSTRTPPSTGRLER